MAKYLDDAGLKTLWNNIKKYHNADMAKYGLIPTKSSNEAVAGDVCLYNKTCKQLVIRSIDDITDSSFDKDDYTPIGVVVVPGTHDVYGNGACGVMSFTAKGYGIGYGSLDTELHNYDKVVHVGTSKITAYAQGIVTPGNVGTSNPECFLPSDKFDTLDNPYDTKTGYYVINLTHLPSPYNDDDSRNPVYYQTTSPSSEDNALSRFDGKYNTQFFCNLATGQSDWKTADELEIPYNKKGYYPLPCYCWRYYTDGTNQGDWYLPAMGELGYVMARYNVIKNSIISIDELYSVDYYSVYSYSRFDSSNEISETSILGLDTDRGAVVCILKYGARQSRGHPFLQLNITASAGSTDTPTCSCEAIDDDTINALE